MGMSNTYRLNIGDVKNNVALIATDGDLDAIAYHIRKADLAVDGEYNVLFRETDGINMNQIRVISELTADGEVVSLVLKKKLKQERTAAGQAFDDSLPHDGDTLDRVE